MSGELEYFLDIVREGDDETVEGARGEMTAELAFQLEREYWKLNNWNERAAMVNLVQDIQDPGLKLAAMMEDALQIPDIGGDESAIVITIAVCYLKQDYSLFDKVFKSYEGSKKAASEILGRKI